MSRRLAAVLSSLLLVHAAGARAAELGEAKVASYIGQQLVADIELVAIDDPASAVQVRLASADVYRGASLDMPAVLSSLNMNVMRRDGRQFLHITSLKPVDADRLHLFLELADGPRRVVRQATLWVTPDPAPPVVAASEPPAVDRWPAAAAPEARRAMAAAPASCPRQTSPAAACALLDVKNAMLRDEVVKLEDKVKLLQTAMGVAPAAAPASATPPAAPVAEKHAALPPPAPRAPVAKVKPDAAENEQAHGGLPWGWIGGLGAAVFALVGSMVARRARRAQKVVEVVDEAVPKAAEPTLD